MAKQRQALLVYIFFISACLGGNTRRDDDENMPGLHGNESLRTKAHIAHGTVISTAIVLWFPLGAIILRLFSSKNAAWWHIVWQMTGMFLLLVGFALGCWLSYLSSCGINPMKSSARSSLVSSSCNRSSAWSIIATSA